MDVKKDLEKDLECKLLRGLPIYINGAGYIHSLTLDEISELGISKYNKFISYLCFDMDDVTLKDKNDLTTFDILVDECLKNVEFVDFILFGLELFFKESVKFHKINDKTGHFIVGDISENRIICRDNYEEIKKILRLKSGIRNKKEDEDNPSDERAKQILRKIKKNRERINNAKENGEELDLYDLISILSSNGNGLNILNIWQLDLYQFNNQFARMQILDSYDISIKSLLAGANKDDVEFKHWLCKV